MGAEDSENAPVDPGRPPAAGPMFCRGCQYPLEGLSARACPECGAAFDPADPATYRRRERSRLRRALSSRWALAAALVVLAGVGAFHTWLPRPYVGRNATVHWTLWVWLDRPYGTHRVTGPTRRIEKTWWHDREIATRIARFEKAFDEPDEAFALSWEVRSLGGDRWSMDVPSAGVRYGDLIEAFNTVRADDQLFGLRLGYRFAEHDTNPAPFSASGPKERVLEALVRVYGLSVEQILTSPDDKLVWVLDEQTGEFEEVSIDEAIRRGLDEPTRDNFFGVRRQTWD